MKYRSQVFTDEEIQFILDNAATMGRNEIAEKLDCRVVQVKGFINRNKIQTGRTGRFEKGNPSWNKGKKGFMGPNRTSFKKGHNPPNRKGVGSERICSKEGYVWVKVEERDPYTGLPTRYRPKHKVVWEQTHGQPVPQGCAIIFKDNDIYNFDPDNLECVTRAELLQLNRNRYKEMPEELKPSTLALSKLQAKYFERRKQK